MFVSVVSNVVPSSLRQAVVVAAAVDQSLYDSAASCIRVVGLSFDSVGPFGVVAYCFLAFFFVAWSSPRPVASLQGSSASASLGALVSLQKKEVSVRSLASRSACWPANRPRRLFACLELSVFLARSIRANGERKEEMTGSSQTANNGAGTGRRGKGRRKERRSEQASWSRCFCCQQWPRESLNPFVGASVGH